LNPHARNGEVLASTANHRVRSAISIAGGVRASLRAACFLVIVLVAWSEYWMRVLPRSSGKRRLLQASWLHRWSVRICRLLAAEIEVRGSPPRSGLVAANHLSYLDVFIFSAIAPCIFVAKKEIAEWPIFGRCTRYSGAILLDRERRAGVAPVAGEMRAALEEDLLVVLFPEGTSSKGEFILPFKPALFAPAVELALPVTGAAIAYELPGGSASDEICYWGGATLLPHMFNLLSKRRLRARVAYAASHPAATDRKVLAHELHATVSVLYEQRASP
jgi:1-acyl-sn-glycerol-3-phosphate acyltransferase